MRKDLISIMDVLSSNAQGLSLAQIAAKTGVPKTSAKRILDTAKANWNLSVIEYGVRNDRTTDINQCFARIGPPFTAWRFAAT